MKRLLDWENGPLYLGGIGAGVGVMGAGLMIVSPSMVGLVPAVLGLIGAMVGVVTVRALTRNTTNEEDA